MGYLSQYFCEKNTLLKELSTLENSNSSELVALKEEKIKMATRDAYLYALGMIVASYYMAIHHTWVFYISHKLGMMHRIVMTGAIFQKVCVAYKNDGKLLCNCRFYILLNQPLANFPLDIL